MSKYLQPVKNLKWAKEFAEILYYSGALGNSGSKAVLMAQAIVKMQYGWEKGFGPMESIDGVDFVQGKPALGAALQASLIDQHEEYSYMVTEKSPKRVSILFYKNGKELGESEFTMEMAIAANLTNKSVWKQYPINMLFARALTNGATFFCPGAVHGRSYIPEELGADPVDEYAEMKVPDVGKVNGGPTRLLGIVEEATGPQGMASEMVEEDTGGGGGGVSGHAEPDNG